MIFDVMDGTFFHSFNGLIEKKEKKTNLWKKNNEEHFENENSLQFIKMIEMMLSLSLSLLC